MTATYKLDPNFVVDIPTKEDCEEVEPINNNIKCHTDGSKLDDNRTGAGVLINNSHNDIAEEAIHLGNNSTVFQAEVFAVGRAASHLIFAETKNKSVFISCNSQAAIMFLENTKIKSKTTLDAVLTLNKLGENNQVTKKPRGATNTDAPDSKVTGDAAIRERMMHHLRPTLRGYGGTNSPSQPITLTVVTFEKPSCSLRDIWLSTTT